MPAILEKIQNTILRHGMIRPGDRVVVGVSGGPDSVCLLDALARLREELAIADLTVVHVNHGLRGEASDGDEAFVRRMAEERGFPCLVYRFDAAKAALEAGIGTEEAGRRFRYHAFEDAARKTGASRIAVAHHFNDQAETVLMRILRGTGTAGLAGIPYVREPGADGGAGMSKGRETEAEDGAGITNGRHPEAVTGSPNTRISESREPVQPSGIPGVVGWPKSCSQAQDPGASTDTGCLDLVTRMSNSGISADTGQSKPLSIIRPLLDLTREEVEGYCAAAGLETRLDASNLEPVYTRNRIRLQLLPLLREEYNGNIDAALVRLGRQAAEENDFLESLARQYLDGMDDRHPDGGNCQNDVPTPQTRKKGESTDDRHVDDRQIDEGLFGGDGNQIHALLSTFQGTKQPDDNRHSGDGDGKSNPPTSLPRNMEEPTDRQHADDVGRINPTMYERSHWSTTNHWNATDRSLSLHGFAGLHPAIAKRVIRMAAERAGVRGDQDAAMVDRVLQLIERSTEAKEVDLVKGYRARLSYGRLWFYRKEENPSDHESQSVTHLPDSHENRRFYILPQRISPQAPIEPPIPLPWDVLEKQGFAVLEVGNAGGTGSTECTGDLRGSGKAKCTGNMGNAGNLRIVLRIESPYPCGYPYPDRNMDMEQKQGRETKADTLYRIRSAIFSTDRSAATVPDTVMLDYDRLCQHRDAVFRNRMPGDRITPVHMKGSKKLQNFFVDRKVPKPERDSMILLVSGGRVLLAGREVAEDCRITEQTKRWLSVSWEVRKPGAEDQNP